MAKKSRTVLNLKEIRSKRESIIIVDPQGKEFDIGGITVDAYLQIIDYENEYRKLQEESPESNANMQKTLLEQTKDFIESLLPGFSTDDLYLDELFMVFSAIQENMVGAQNGLNEVGNIPTDEGEEKNLTLPV